MSEAGRLAIASFMKIALMFPIIALFLKEISMRACVVEVLIDFIFTFFLLVSSRVLLITFYNLIVNNVNSSCDRLLIFIGDRGTTGMLAPLFDKRSLYQVEGYLRVGDRSTMRIGGYKVYSCYRF